jgi:hypothetical protein
MRKMYLARGNYLEISSRGIVWVQVRLTQTSQRRDRVTPLKWVSGSPIDRPGVAASECYKPRKLQPKISFFSIVRFIIIHILKKFCFRKLFKVLYEFY